ncbi:MAG: hypothetical protein R3B06_19830 [Kofleriaceae bacterium]
MLIIALAVAAVTARFLGLRPGAIAGGVSLAALVVASLAPLPLALVVYVAHAVWVAGVWFYGQQVAAQRKRSAGATAARWIKRGRSLWKWR